MPDRLNKAFEAFLEDAFPDGSIESQRDECRRIFYEGAKALYYDLMAEALFPSDDEDANVDVIQLYGEELEKFFLAVNGSLAS